MASVGLLYVGAVLLINGVMLLGWMDARAAAPLNLFVGALQVFTPTYLIVTSGGDPDVILSASGIYLFGFTYLYVGINLLGDLDGAGLGWFSGFVAVCAIVYSALNFSRFDDPAFGVIWLYWAFLWALFFVVLGLKREEFTRFTGAVAIVAGIVTAAVPAFLLLTGKWADNTRTWAIVIAVICILSLALYPRLRQPRATAGTAPAPELRETSTPTPRPSQSAAPGRDESAGRRRR
ncbi:AmiS/UreI family transporter [Geodermatophilus ruber]|uniref:AmiS/UreI family transporter n=1 Tax=Geodermatophilus ruber TaxID=504800 RepID=A0A1I4HV35_9ACTN|nr:AmiS/UreI family transporter [Geodermatophilus ruber]SFL45286.1 AmiS/UreI family transporter [Geodermatophilus ruber]